MAGNIDDEIKILVVFDINGTLMTRLPRNMAVQSKLVEGPLCMRPFSPELAEYLNKNNINYAFWTTQSEGKAQQSFEMLQKFGFNNPRFLWKQDKCKNGHIKDLSFVSNEFPEYKPENIIIVDDSEHKIVDKSRYIRVGGFNFYNLARDDEMTRLTDYFKRMFNNIKAAKFDDCMSYMLKNKYSFF